MSKIRDEIVELKKKLASVESSNRYNNDRANDLFNQLAQIHAFLDCVPNPPPRSVTGKYSDTEVSALARIVSYLVTR